MPLLDVDSVRYNVVEQMRRARREVTLVSSPYLIPGTAGLELMREMRGRGVTISLVTNSLAATDEPLVHTGYRRYRPAMLRLGVELHELSSERTRRSVRLGIFGSSVGRLHAKTAVFDQQQAVRRLDELRPALGRGQHRDRPVHPQSPRWRARSLKLIEQLKQQGAWRVQLAADGRLDRVAQQRPDDPQSP